MNSIFYGSPKNPKMFGGKFQQLAQYINNNNNNNNNNNALINN